MFRKAVVLVTNWSLFLHLLLELAVACVSIVGLASCLSCYDRSEALSIDSGLNRRSRINYRIVNDMVVPVLARCVAIH